MENETFNLTCSASIRNKIWLCRAPKNQDHSATAKFHMTNFQEDLYICLCHAHLHDFNKFNPIVFDCLHDNMRWNWQMPKIVVTWSKGKLPCLALCAHCMKIGILIVKIKISYILGFVGNMNKDCTIHIVGCMVNW